jgi:hypothetical protein
VRQTDRQTDRANITRGLRTFHSIEFEVMEAAAAQFDMKKLQGCAAAATTTTTSVGDSGFKRICVFCGSSSGNKTVYLEVARELGTELVSTHALLHTA